MASHLAEAPPNQDDEQNGNDLESKKSSQLILRHELAEARHALERSTSRLIVSGFAAGLEVGFSLLLMGIVITLAEEELVDLLRELFLATMYSFGFILVVIGRSELFTEQTSLAVLPLLSRQTTFWKVARLWGLVYVSNLLGGAAIAYVIVAIGPAMEVVDRPIFGDIAQSMVDHPGWVILLSGILAGWLMGLVSWLVAAGRDTISQIVIVWLITSAIGFAHLHHVVLGTVEVLGGVFSGSGTTWGDYGHFLLWTTLGNAMGGSCFVAVLKFGPARPSRRRRQWTEKNRVVKEEAENQ